MVRRSKRKRLSAEGVGARQAAARDPAGDDLRWPHRLAVALCWVVFPLISVGGLVTTYDAGMAVPDWPSTYGYNLFLYPWSTWIFGPWDLFLEHSHRLLGALAGVITIALVVSVFWSGCRRGVRWAACIGLVLVIAQGCLGGARVLLDERQLAMIHGCAGPAFFSYCVGLAVVTSSLWGGAEGRTIHRRARRYRRLAGLTVLFIYIQLVLGAQLRHIPVTATRFVFNMSLILHLASALLVVLQVVLVGASLGRLRQEWALRRPALVLVNLVAVQIVLGTATWVVTYGWPYWFAGYRFAAAYIIPAKSMFQTTTVTLHVATGSLLLGTAVLLWLRSLRLLRDETTVSVSRTSWVGWFT